MSGALYLGGVMTGYTTDREVTGQTEQVQIMFPLRWLNRVYAKSLTAH